MPLLKEGIGVEREAQRKGYFRNNSNISKFKKF
jgi:hypothetical protein